MFFFSQHRKCVETQALSMTDSEKWWLAIRLGANSISCCLDRFYHHWNHDPISCQPGSGTERWKEFLRPQCLCETFVVREEKKKKAK